MSYSVLAKFYDGLNESVDYKSWALEISDFLNKKGITAPAKILDIACGTGKMTLERLVYLMSDAPRERFSIDSDTGFTVFDLDSEYVINPDDFLSMGRATPFEGERVFGKCLLTVYGGRAVYENLVK